MAMQADLRHHQLTIGILQALLAEMETDDLRHQADTAGRRIVVVFVLVAQVLDVVLQAPTIRVLL